MKRPWNPLRYAPLFASLYARLDRARFLKAFYGEAYQAYRTGYGLVLVERPTRLQAAGSVRERGRGELAGLAFTFVLLVLFFGLVVGVPVWVLAVGCPLWLVGSVLLWRVLLEEADA